MASLDLIINAVFERPGIWCSKHPYYKNQHIAAKLWQQVQALMPECEVSEIKRKWKNAKDNFRKEVRKMERMKTTLEEYDSPWQYFKELSFLYDEVTQKTKKMTQTKEATEESNTNTEKTNPTSNDIDANVLKRRPNANSVDPEMLDTERKKPKLIEIEIGNEGIEETNPYRGSEDYHFLMSLLPHMQKLNAIQKFRLRIIFNEALMAEMAACNDETNTEQVTVKTEILIDDS